MHRRRQATSLTSVSCVLYISIMIELAGTVADVGHASDATVALGEALEVVAAGGAWDEANDQELALEEPGAAATAGVVVVADDAVDVAELLFS